MDIYTDDLDTKRHWYSDAAESYNSCRPKYPDAVVECAIAAAGLSQSSRLLEVGCGPETATVAFASRGFPMVCVEPNPDFVALAKRNCADYPDVCVAHSSFEEYSVVPESFHAVVATSAFHWISPETAYSKAHVALVDGVGWSGMD